MKKRQRRERGDITTHNNKIFNENIRTWFKKSFSSSWNISKINGYLSRYLQHTAVEQRTTKFLSSRIHKREFFQNFSGLFLIMLKLFYKMQDERRYPRYLLKSRWLLYQIQKNRKEKIEGIKLLQANLENGVLPNILNKILANWFQDHTKI